MKRKNIKFLVMDFFLVNPTIKIRVRQLEKKLNVPFPSIVRYTKELTNEGVLKKEEISNVILYSADRTSKKYLIEKKLYNLRMLYESELVDYLINEISNPVIVVFGSYSRGEDIENSDIDLYFETSFGGKIKLDKFEKILKRSIQLFIHKSIREVRNKNLMDNIINGITLNNFMVVFE